MPDTIFLDFLHPAQVSIDAGPEGLVAVRLLEWARAAGSRGLIHVARSETRAQRLVRALRGLAPQLEVLMLPPWDCLPYDRAGPSRRIMGQRIAATPCAASRWPCSIWSIASNSSRAAPTGAPSRRCSPVRA